MPKKARGAREQPSPGPTRSVNAPVAGGMAWAAQLHAVMQHHAWAAVLRRLEVQPGSLLRIRFSWLLCVRSRQALLVDTWTSMAGSIFQHSLLFVVVLKHPNVPPELYNLTDLVIGDLECARVVAQGIMKAQLNVEGQKYLTSSMVIPIIEELRKSLRSTRMLHYYRRSPWRQDSGGHH